MTNGQAAGKSDSTTAQDWARFQEAQFEPFYAAVHERLAIGPGIRLLDVGCGPGGSAARAAGQGALVAGLDVAAGSIALAQERVPNGDFRVGDMETLPWENESFDVVTGFNSFQFARTHAVALAEARRVTTQDGKLGMVIWAPPQLSQQTILMAAVGALAPPAPPNSPGPFALSAPGAAERALEAAGWRLVDRGEMQVVFEYPDEESACRVAMAGSSGIRAVQHVGEERVRQAILAELEQFRVETGGFRTENLFRFLIAE